MRQITINENDELEVDDATASEIVQMIIEEPSLPISMTNNIVSFDAYTVGTIQVGELGIEIKPRNSVFTLEKLFEMLLYESINNFDEKYVSNGFGDNQSFGFAAVTSQFYFECAKLVKFGLTGDFVSKVRRAKEIAGPLLLDKFHPKEIAVNGVTFVNETYTVDIIPNQIIKSAIIKLLHSEYRPEIRRNYQLLLREFVSVGGLTENLNGIETLCQKFYSANTHYPLVLEFAIKILKEMKMKFNNGNLTWYAFLHNSNDIFEKYVRKVVSKGIDSYVSKWDKPKEIAILDDGIRTGTKSYVPDILIDYDRQKGTAKAVLDAKNKKFNPDKGDIGEILHSADMYQMTFYCDKLKTKLGGLIYPTGKNHKPISVLIDGNQDFRFVLFSINMNERIAVRHRKLCNAIKEYLLYYV